MFSKSLRILDGGSGIEALELCRDKVENNKCWSSSLLFEHKDIVRKIHRKFLDVGCELITTLSYQADPVNLSESFGISRDDAEQLMMDSVIIAKEEVEKVKQDNDRQILVAASVGCYGTHLADMSEYTGNYVDRVSLFEIREMYEMRLEPLIRAEPDLIAFETIPTLQEVEIILSLMRQHPNTPCWISVSEKLACGDGLDQAISCFNQFAGSNVFGFGANCVMPIFDIRKIVRSIKNLLDPSKLIVLYPSSGAIWKNKKPFYPEGVNDETFCKELPYWIAEGANWIGGCCLMDSRRMEEVSEIIKQYRGN